MNNQHEAITGYRSLTQNEINLMNEVKAYIGLGKVLADKLQAHANAQIDATRSYISLDEEMKLIHALPKDQQDLPTGMVQTPEAKAEWLRIIAAEPHRWISIGKTDLQTAGMAFARAVAQPTTF